MRDDTHSSAPMPRRRIPISPNTDRRRRQLIEYERLNIPPDPIKRADWSPLASNTLIEAQLARAARLPVRPLERKLPGFVVVLLVVLGLLAMWLGVTGCSGVTKRTGEALRRATIEHAMDVHEMLCSTSCAPVGHCEPGAYPHRLESRTEATAALRADVTAMCRTEDPCANGPLCDFLWDTLAIVEASR